MRRQFPVIAGALLVAVAVACGGAGGADAENRKAFCADVRQLRTLGREPGSVEPADPQQLAATIAGLRDLERSAPSDVKGDITLIRETLETIAALGEGQRVDPERVEKLAEDEEKIRESGKHIDREVQKCGIAVPST
jgi:hypothetical protein